MGLQNGQGCRPVVAIYLRVTVRFGTRESLTLTGFHMVAPFC